jgi:epoxyqueuosine reductase
MKEDLKSRLREKAKELGCSSIGVARAEHLSDGSLHLTEWLRRGYQASMGWMERNVEKRTDPTNIVPNARSVISVAMNYYTDAQHSENPLTGKISRYAWGDDYHDVLGERMDQLQRWLEEQVPNSTCRWYVDTGPVMDKAWAVRAGIGWLGKHTNVITKEFGSWVFLGEIITDIALEPDEPIADFCGTCTACLEACPTGAIVEPYIVDSNRCISYLTIEHRGPIAEEFHPMLNNWVYGCDICQDVCPWNRFQKVSSEKAFEPRSHNLNPPLAELSELSDEEFRTRMKRSPMKRTKSEGLRRNARAVLERDK